MMPGEMNRTPASTPPSTPSTRHPMRIAICDASGPGSTCTKLSARTKSASSSQWRRSTHSSCISPSWATGPPKASQPIRKNTRPRSETRTEGAGMPTAGPSLVSPRACQSLRQPRPVPTLGPHGRSHDVSQTLRWLLVPLAAALGCAGSQQEQKVAKAGGNSTLVDEVRPRRAPPPGLGRSSGCSRCWTARQRSAGSPSRAPTASRC